MNDQALLKHYKENEECNAHAENLLLLAEYFEDERAIRLAHQNLNFANLNGYVNNKHREAANNACGHYYYKIIKRQNQN